MPYPGPFSFFNFLSGTVLVCRPRELFICDIVSPFNFENASVTFVYVVQRVRLHFLSFHLQESTDCSYDSIKVYDGKDTTASLMRTVCGTTIPEDITSSTHTLFIHFSSGDTSTYSAFQIYYSDLVVPGGKIL